MNNWLLAYLLGAKSGGGGGGDAHGIPSGGTSGQVLAKNSGTDYDAGWVNPPSAGATQLNDLSDVNLGSPGDYFRLAYAAQTQKWVARNPAYAYSIRYSGSDVYLNNSDSFGPTMAAKYGLYAYATDNSGGVDRELPMIAATRIYNVTAGHSEGHAWFLDVDASANKNMPVMRHFVEDWSNNRYYEVPMPASEIASTWVGTQAEYDAIATKDPHTLYCIKE